MIRPKLWAIPWVLDGMRSVFSTSCQIEPSGRIQSAEILDPTLLSGIRLFERRADLEDLVRKGFLPVLADGGPEVSTALPSLRPSVLNVLIPTEEHRLLRQTDVAAA
jgi:hypothetical protein